MKAYGLFIVFNVDAVAGKFDMIQLAFNVGAGLALLGFVSLEYCKNLFKIVDIEIMIEPENYL